MESRALNKGEHGHECNRTACNNQNAMFFNKSTRKYYCEDCASTINTYNELDSLRMFNNPKLCEYEELKEELNIDEDSLFNKPLTSKTVSISDEYIYEFRECIGDGTLSKGYKLKHSAHYENIRTEPKQKRNEPCSCGSGLKFKKCCGKIS